MAVSQICEVLPTGFNDKDPQADGTVLALNAAAERRQDRRCRKKLSQLCSRLRTSRIKFSAWFRQQGAVQSLLVCCNSNRIRDVHWKLRPYLRRHASKHRIPVSCVFEYRASDRALYRGKSSQAMWKSIRSFISSICSPPEQTISISLTHGK